MLLDFFKNLFLSHYDRGDCTDCFSGNELLRSAHNAVTISVIRRDLL